MFSWVDIGSLGSNTEPIFVRLEEEWQGNASCAWDVQELLQQLNCWTFSKCADWWHDFCSVWTGADVLLTPTPSTRVTCTHTNHSCSHQSLWKGRQVHPDQCGSVTDGLISISAGVRAAPCTVRKTDYVFEVMSHQTLFNKCLRSSAWRLLGDVNH